MTDPAQFAESWLPNGIQTLDGQDVVGVVVATGYDPTAVTVADVTGGGAEVGVDRIGGTFDVPAPGEDGWTLFVLDPTSTDITAPMLGVWLALDGATDADRLLVAFSPAPLESGTFDPSWDSGVIFLPFESRGVGVESLVAGANITIDDSDPEHPKISASGGGGSGLPAGGDLGQTVVNTGDGTGEWSDLDAAHVIIDPSGDAIPVDLAFTTAVGLITPLQNLPWLRPVSLVATSNVDVSSAPSTIDGVTVSGYVLLTGQTDPTENRIYSAVTGPGNPMTVSTLHTAASQVDGAVVKVTQGTTHAGQMWSINSGSVNSGDAVWEDVTGGGGGSGPDLSDADPLAPGTADEGTSPDASRADHVHPRQTGIVNSEIDAAAAIAQSKISGLTTDLGNKQPLDADLTAIAGVTSAADKAPYFTGSGTASVMTVTSAARTVLDDTTTAAMLATLGGAAAVTASAGIWIGTQAAYDGLGSWSSTVLYVVTP